MKEKSFTTRQQLAEDLGIDVKTLRRCLQKYEIDLKPGLIPVGVADDIKEVLRKFRLSESSSNNGTKFDANN